jgi:hypothetical protein
MRLCPTETGLSSPFERERRQEISEANAEFGDYPALLYSRFLSKSISRSRCARKYFRRSPSFVLGVQVFCWKALAIWASSNAAQHPRTSKACAHLVVKRWSGL